jgi:hypothetical protein
LGIPRRSYCGIVTSSSSDTVQQKKAPRLTCLGRRASSAGGGRPTPAGRNHTSCTRSHSVLAASTLLDTDMTDYRSHNIYSSEHTRCDRRYPRQTDPYDQDSPPEASRISSTPLDSLSPTIKPLHRLASSFMATSLKVDKDCNS